MKFCDPRTKLILTGERKHIENKCVNYFMVLPEKADYFVFPPSHQICCTTALQEREKY